MGTWNWPSPGRQVHHNLQGKSAHVLGTHRTWSVLFGNCQDTRVEPPPKFSPLLGMLLWLPTLIYTHTNYNHWPNSELVSTGTESALIYADYIPRSCLILETWQINCNVKCKAWINCLQSFDSFHRDKHVMWKETALKCTFKKRKKIDNVLQETLKFIHKNYTKLW
jgi:hypothetical protein